MHFALFEKNIQVVFPVGHQFTANGIFFISKVFSYWRTPDSGPRIARSSKDIKSIRQDER